MTSHKILQLFLYDIQYNGNDPINQVHSRKIHFFMQTHRYSPQNRVK